MSDLHKIEIVFEMNGVLAVNKPAGLPTQAPWGIESVESLIRRQKFHQHFEDAIESGGTRHPGGFLGYHIVLIVQFLVSCLALTPERPDSFLAI